MKTAIIAIVMFCFLIFVHELGHFIAAKSCDVKVNKFALGMGPAFFKKKKGETEYSLRVFPIGGFCEMEGENGDVEEKADESSENPRAFSNKKAWQKIVILFAGPAMNGITALLLMAIILFTMGTATTTVNKVLEDSPALEAGVKAGDKVISIDGKKIEEWTDVGDAVGASKSDHLLIKVKRDGKEVSLSSAIMEQDGTRMIGIEPKRDHSAVDAIVGAPKYTWDVTKQMYIIIKDLVTGQVSAKELSGPVGIVYLVNETTKTGIMNVIYLMALLSLNLGIFNLLPFPALDGGRIVFVLLRKITGRLITDKMEAAVNATGMMLLLALMVYVTWNDIVRFIAPLF